MGFKMKGTSMHSGTSKHKSALKIQSVEARKQAVSAAGMESGSGEASASPAKVDLAYGGTKTWGKGQEDSGGNLNDWSNAQNAYEAKMEKKDPKWNKREDNTWKKTQNKINASLGSKKVYDVTKDIATKEVDRSGDGEKDTKVMRGIGSNKGNTLTTKEKSLEKANVSTQKDIIKKSKGDKKSATTKEDKNTAKNTRDEAQKEIGEIRSGRDNEKTGTVVSRFLGKRKAKRNQRQLDKREKKNSPAQKHAKRSPAKCPLIAAAAPALIAGVAGGIGKKAAAKKLMKGVGAKKGKTLTADKKRSPAKCPLIAAAAPALIGAAAKGLGKKAGEKAGDKIPG